MQSVLLIAAKALSAAKTIGAVFTGAGAAGGATAAGATTGAATGAAAGASALGAMRTGTSALSAISTFADGLMRAKAMKQEAFGEELQARQEYIQAQERSNTIADRYTQTVSDQLALATASGVDINSGSVVAARQQAQADADRELTIDRNSTEVRASLRRSRARQLRFNARATVALSAADAVASVGQSLMGMQGVK